jgi:para-aminobenzoate synthetase component 1
VPQAPAGRFTPERTREQYARAFRKIKRSIYNGDIYQINLSHRLRAETQLPARTLFANIMEKNPVGFLAYIEGDGYELLSASPERFVKTENRRIWTCPIKGTRPRGRTRASDARYRAALVRSPKEAAELNMITDLLRNDLGRVCRIGSVRVAGSRLVRKCPAVWHTYASVTGSILPELTPLDALLSMLPGGSITGCPKKRALEIIDELEPTARSVYTGVIGSINPDRDLDFSIAIRTIIKKNGKLYLQVGGGIVHASDEQEEYRETLAKAQSLMNIF